MSKKVYKKYTKYTKCHSLIWIKVLITGFGVKKEISANSGVKIYDITLGYLVNGRHNKMRYSLLYSILNQSDARNILR